MKARATRKVQGAVYGRETDLWKQHVCSRNSVHRVDDVIRSEFHVFVAQTHEYTKHTREKQEKHARMSTRMPIEIVRSVCRRSVEMSLDDWKGSRGHALNAALINTTLDHEVAVDTPRCAPAVLHATHRPDMVEQGESVRRAAISAELDTRGTQGGQWHGALTSST